MMFSMEGNKKQLLTLGLIVSGFMLTGYMAVSVIPQRLVSFSKAAPMTKVSINSSYILGSKMLAKADGLESCKVNVFVVDSNGRGIADKTVTLTGIETVKALTSKTNADGKISFEITSKVEGQFPITALVGGVAIPNKVVVTFRNSD